MESKIDIKNLARGDRLEVKGDEGEGLITEIKTESDAQGNSHHVLASFAVGESTYAREVRLGEIIRVIPKAPK